MHCLSYIFDPLFSIFLPSCLLHILSENHILFITHRALYEFLVFTNPIVHVATSVNDIQPVSYRILSVLVPELTRSNGYSVLVCLF